MLHRMSPFTFVVVAAPYRPLAPSVTWGADTPTATHQRICREIRPARHNAQRSDVLSPSSLVVKRQKSPIAIASGSSLPTYFCASALPLPSPTQCVVQGRPCCSELDGCSD